MTKSVPAELIKYLNKRQRAELDILLSEQQDPTPTLIQFLMRGWHVLEPTTKFVPGWHIEAICDHLTAVAEGQIRRLLINVPPGSCKAVSVGSLVHEKDLGRIPLGDVAVGHRVLTHFGTFCTVEATHDQGLLDTLKISTTSSREIVTAYDHPFETITGWTQAQELRVGDLLRLILDEDDPGWMDRITSIEINGKADCRCLTIEDAHSFTANDISVRNSLTCSVFFPAWVWTRDPSMRFLTASYAGQLSTRDAVRCRRLILSPWYQSQWGDKFKLSGDQNQKTRYENDKTGYRVATSVGGPVTGERGNCRVLDDPHKPEEALSDEVREDTINWVKTTWSTRDADPRASSEIVIMQRLHERDVSGYLMTEVGGYEHLCLPMRYEQDRKCTTRIFTDPREKAGELLCPERFDEQAVQDLEIRLMIHAAGQLQQRPSAAEGEIFKAHLWRFWYPTGRDAPPPWQIRQKDGSFVACVQEPIPTGFERQLQSWDLAFKDTKDSAFVVGQVWGLKQATVYLLYQSRAHMDFTTTCATLKEVTSKYPLAAAKFVEDAANGPAVISQLRRQVSGLIPVKVEGSKQARAQAISPFQVAGNLYLPHPVIYPWVKELLLELTQFPNSRYKDQTDALTQAVSHLLLQRKALSGKLYEINQTSANVPGLAANMMRQQW